MADKYGTNGADVINGTEDDDGIYGGPQDGDPALETGDDEINGLGGNDTILGLGGNDTLSGGEGQDHLDGGDGNDTIHGLEGDDVLVGGSGDDVIGGGDGIDTLVLSGNSTDYDVLSNSDGTYTVIDLRSGGDGVDIISDIETVQFSNGSLGFHVLVDREGVFGTNSPDNPLNGTPDFDNIYGFAGDDVINGLAGEDWIAGGEGNDVIDGGSGTDDDANGIWDAVDYMRDAIDGGTQGVSVNLATGTATDTFGDTDTLVDIERVFATNFDDTLIGSDEDEGFDPHGGDDHVDGGGGFDELMYQLSVQYGGSGGIVVTPNNGTGETGDGTVVDPFGNTDTFANIESIRGTQVSDIVSGDAGALRFRGLGGDDTFDGGDGADEADYRADANHGGMNGISADLENTDASGFGVVIDGFGASDRIKNVEKIRGTGVSDTIRGDGSENFFWGEAGDDVLDGRAGNDSLDGNDGNDILIGGSGADTLIGGSGVDIASYSTSAARLVVDLANLTNNTGDAAGDEYFEIEGIRGSVFDDSLRGDNLNNTLQGAEGDDILRGRGGADTLDGGDGYDIADYQGATVGVTVDLSNAANNVGESAGDTFVSIEGIRGSALGDVLIGDSYDNTLLGGDGGDTFVGGDGADFMNGGTGIDTVDYSAEGGTSGVLVNLLGNGSQLGLAADSAKDTFGKIDTVTNIANVIGTARDDKIYGGTHDNKLFGRAGNDELKGGIANDTLDGGADTDTAIYTGTLSDYQITRNPDGSLTIADQRSGSPDGTDTLTNVELFAFADGSKTLAELLNSSPAITSNGGGETAAVSIDENETAVTTVSAADPDTGATLSYSIVGGADAAKFQIDAVTGALSFVAAPDFEVPTDTGTDNVYQVQVQVDDGQGGTDAQMVSVTVTNVNDNGPVFTSGNSASTAENASGIVYDADANDSDNLAALTYSISGGDAALFNIDAATGVVTFKAPPDFENPLDHGSNNTYDFQVTASDREHSSVLNVSVIVTDQQNSIVGDGADNLLVGTASTEDTIVGLDGNDTLIGDDLSDILDGGEGNDFLAGQSGSDTLIGGSGNDTFSGNAIDWNGDRITDYQLGEKVLVAFGSLNPAAYRLRHEGSDSFIDIDANGDGNFDSSITLSGIVSGTLVVSQYSDPQYVQLVIQNNPPTITFLGGGDNVAASVHENQFVSQISATDPDFGNELTYSIVGGLDANLFAIDSRTGDLSFIVPPDYENPNPNGGLVDQFYQVEVQVSDGHDGVDTQTITVTVENANDTAPTFTSGLAASVAENSTGVVYDADATDADDLAGLTYSLSGTDATLFNIDASTGEVTFKVGPNFEAPADAGSNNVYDITVTAFDGANSTDRGVTITVTDVTEGNVIDGTEDNNTLNGTAAVDIINGFGGSDTLNGRASDDELDGGAGDDLLNGGTGNDLMRGGAGNDTYLVDATGDIIDEGATGSDGTDRVQSSISFSLADPVRVLGNVENLTLTGNAAINGTGNAAANNVVGNNATNALDGGEGDDTLDARGGNDTLDGGEGNDTMRGGGGNDTYVVDNINDVIDEGGSGGADTVLASISFSLVTSLTVLGTLENLTLTGTGNTDGTGNSANNILIGNVGNNVLDGGGGADTMRGGAGDDTYVVNSSSDRIDESVAGSDGDDTVRSSVTFSLANANRVLGAVENLMLTGSASINATGNALDNILIGNIGANVLDGGLGADTMQGGSGSDTYVVDNTNDTVDEAASGSNGTDTVRSSVTFSLANAARVLGNVENLTLTGTAGINATGNDLDNALIGNSGANILDGGGGADTMRGGGGNDTYVVDSVNDLVNESGSNGVDTIQSSVSFSLADPLLVLGVVENLTLTGSANINGIGNAANNVLRGNSGANVLDGGSGNDTLEGGEGDDTMRGGAGNDIYVVDSADDTIDESVANSTGTDTVQSSITFSLLNSARVLGVFENVTLTGTAGINATGNTANNVLTGNAGANVLDGGAGNDTLTGGIGADTFLFSTALNASTNRDTITDFNVADDTVALDGSIFTTLGGTGTLAAEAFHIGTAAADANDRIIYNPATGTLTYDTNGNAAGGAVQFANIGTGQALTNTDFAVA